MESGGYRCLCRLTEDVVMEPTHNDTPRKALDDMLMAINDFRTLTEEEQEEYIKKLQDKDSGTEPS